MQGDCDARPSTRNELRGRGERETSLGSFTKTFVVLNTTVRAFVLISLGISLEERLGVSSLVTTLLTLSLLDWLPIWKPVSTLRSGSDKNYGEYTFRHQYSSGLFVVEIALALILLNHVVINALEFGNHAEIFLHPDRQHSVVKNGPNVAWAVVILTIRASINLWSYRSGIWVSIWGHNAFVVAKFGFLFSVFFMANMGICGRTDVQDPHSKRCLHGMLALTNLNNIMTQNSVFTRLKQEISKEGIIPGPERRILLSWLVEVTITFNIGMFLRRGTGYGVLIPYLIPTIFYFLGVFESSIRSDPFWVSSGLVLLGLLLVAQDVWWENKMVRWTTALVEVLVIMDGVRWWWSSRKRWVYSVDRRPFVDTNEHGELVLYSEVVTIEWAHLKFEPKLYTGTDHTHTARRRRVAEKGSTVDGSYIRNTGKSTSTELGTTIPQGQNHGQKNRINMRRSTTPPQARSTGFMARIFGDVRSYILSSFQGARRIISNLFRKAPGPGMARVEWRCACGVWQSTTVLAADLDEAVKFAQEAAGPSQMTSVSVTTSEDGSSSDTSSAQTATSQPSQQAQAALSTPNSSVQDLSQTAGGASTPQIPPGSPKFLLLCVLSSNGLTSLGHVDLTTCGEDQVAFQLIKSTYEFLQGTWRNRNPFVQAKSIEYIQFEAMDRPGSGLCLLNRILNSYPPVEEVAAGRYDYRPCPPKPWPVPIASEVFMHSLRNPSHHHQGDQLLRRLPKKLHARLVCETGMASAPVGWGIYVVEGLHWGVVCATIVLAVMLTTVMVMAFSIQSADVQTPVAIGQYVVASIAILMTAAIVGRSSVVS